MEVVQKNLDCEFCQFICTVVRASPAWNKALQNSLNHYLHYRKRSFGYRSMNTLEPSTEYITTLFLELMDGQEPAKSSSPFLSLEHLGLQCIQFPPTQNNGPFRGILGGRHIGKQLDFILVNFWLESCNSHGQQWFDTPKDTQTNLRITLIDIKSRRLTQATTSVKYAALSYVWGPPSTQQVRLTRATQAEFSIGGSLNEDNTAIPRTIRDAMIVCNRLAIPFLWVDALCIIQDGPDISAHLHVMNDIYAASYLTIVAASGTDSWAGLPGVMPDSRKVHQPSILIEGFHIGVALPDFKTSVMHSPWAKRGWTFQERLFSKRMLIFAAAQCFFYCDKMTRYESTMTEVCEEDKRIEWMIYETEVWERLRKNFKLSFGITATTSKSLATFFELAQEYRRLTFTYQRDILGAFGGILAAFERGLSTSFYFGLPISYFTLALLLDYTQCIRRPEFPSWSWTGW